MGRGLGAGMRAYKDGISGADEDRDELDGSAEADERP
jgi:Sec-independent protein translocase protein TatA